MSTSIDVVKTLLTQYEDIKKLYEVKLEERSEIDRSISNFYHYVEAVDITHVSQSHKLIKDLKLLLGKRRDNKLEGLILKTTLDNIKISTSNIKGNLNKVVVTHNKMLDDMKVKANTK